MVLSDVEETIISSETREVSEHTACPDGSSLHLPLSRPDEQAAQRDALRAGRYHHLSKSTVTHVKRISALLGVESAGRKRRSRFGHDRQMYVRVMLLS